MNKTLLHTITILSIVVACISTLMYHRVYKSCGAWRKAKLEFDLIEKEVELARVEREYWRQRADYSEHRADSIAQLISSLKSKSNKTKIVYEKQIDAWRALPANDRDVRVHFFSKELATVDSVPEW